MLTEGSTTTTTTMSNQDRVPARITSCYAAPHRSKPTPTALNTQLRKLHKQVSMCARRFEALSQTHDDIPGVAATAACRLLYLHRCGPQAL